MIISMDMHGAAIDVLTGAQHEQMSLVSHSMPRHSQLNLKNLKPRKYSNLKPRMITNQLWFK